MRRLSCVSGALTAGAALRGVHSITVMQNVTPAKVSEKLGGVAPKEAVAAANRVPVALMEKACNPRLLAFTEMDLGRMRFAPLVATINEKVDFNHLEHQVAGRYNQDASKRNPVPGALKKFMGTAWTDMTAVMTFYEETMYPIRMKHNEFKDHELTSFHIKDVLKRGLSAFKQDHLDQQKMELEKVKANMKACQDFVTTAVADAFSTNLCNDLANILRVGGETHPHSHRMALKVLDDMAMMKVPYNAATNEILQATTFGDGPFDNSPLLFEVIEYPERGEIAIGDKSLEATSDDILKLISNRHQTPLDDGALLRSPDTHPNLQRSPE